MSTKQKFIQEGGDVGIVHENEKPKVGKEYAKRLAIIFDESVEYDDSGVIAPKDLALQDISESLDGLKIQRRRFAIKNSKNESDILSKSAFFKTKDGKLLISRAEGTTYRKNHQGSNSWSLFNVEGIMPSRPKSPRKESWIDFGTYGGAENNMPWLYENDITPIGQEEWEERTGRKFKIEKEFPWFSSEVESYGLDKVYNNDVENITTLACYKDHKKVLVVEDKENFLYNGFICYFDNNFIYKKSHFKLFDDAQKQAKLIGGVVLKVEEKDEYIVYSESQLEEPVDVKFIPGETDGYFKESSFEMGITPKEDGWYDYQSCSGAKGLSSGYLNFDNHRHVAVWKSFSGYPEKVYIKKGKIVKIANLLSPETSSWS